MIKEIFKTLGLFAFFYCLFIFEMSYLPFFTFFSFSLSLVLLVNILEEPQGRTGFLSAFSVGLLWDIYSGNQIGMMAVGLMISSLIIKLILQTYVRIPSLSWIPKI